MFDTWVITWEYENHVHSAEFAGLMLVQTIVNLMLNSDVSDISLHRKGQSR